MRSTNAILDSAATVFAFHNHRPSSRYLVRGHPRVNSLIGLMYSHNRGTSFFDRDQDHTTNDLAERPIMTSASRTRQLRAWSMEHGGAGSQHSSRMAGRPSITQLDRAQQRGRANANAPADVDASMHCTIPPWPDAHPSCSCSWCSECRVCPSTPRRPSAVRELSSVSRQLNPAFGEGTQHRPEDWSPVRVLLVPTG